MKVLRMRYLTVEMHQISERAILGGSLFWWHEHISVDLLDSVKFFDFPILTVIAVVNNGELLWSTESSLVRSQSKWRRKPTNNYFCFLTPHDKTMPAPIVAAKSFYSIR